MKRTLAIAACAALLLTAGVAQADISKKVQKAFRGQILITEKGLPISASSDKTTIAAFKKARATSLTHAKTDEGVAEWTFQYTAFFKKKLRGKSLKFEFYTADKANLYVADKGLMGIDPSLPILSGQLSITEDDGLNVGRTYIVKLVGQVKGRDFVYAKTKVTMK